MKNQDKAQAISRQIKKQAVLNPPKTKRGLLIVALVCAVATVAWAGFPLKSNKTADPTTEPTAGIETQTSSETEVVYSAALFNDGQARHFEYSAGNTTIRYFILKSSDGIIRAAFDACDVCWPAGRGYVQDGDVMVCRNCGRRFSSVRINEIKGGCNPAPLNRRVQDDRLIIDVADIMKGQSYFNFKDRG